MSNADNFYCRVYSIETILNRISAFVAMKKLMRGINLHMYWSVERRSSAISEEFCFILKQEEYIFASTYKNISHGQVCYAQRMCGMKMLYGLYIYVRKLINVSLFFPEESSNFKILERIYSASDSYHTSRPSKQ